MTELVAGVPASEVELVLLQDERREWRRGLSIRIAFKIKISTAGRDSLHFGSFLAFSLLLSF